jgi:hypothetical protein
MARWKWRISARSTPVAGQAVGEIRANVTVGGDVSGQLAVGSNIVQMRVDTVLGNLITVLPKGARAKITARPVPISLVPRRPAVMFDRQHETALAVDAISTRRPVELYAPAGMGKSTLLRSLAHHTPVGEVCGGVAHLSARGLSHDDLLQCLFDVFYSSDIPVKPSPGELRHYLQHVHAALLLDDVELPDEDVADLEDYAPECGFVLTTRSAHAASDAQPIPLRGLRGADASALIAHALGRPLQPDEQDVIDGLCDLVQGAPAGLLRLAAAARDFHGTLADFAATARAAGVPPIQLDSDEDLRLLGLLAAIPGVHLDVTQLSAITGVPDVQHRIDRLVARGLVLTSAPPVSTGARVAYSLAGGVDLGPADTWQMEQWRAELREYFLRLAEQRSDTLLAPGAPEESLRALHADAAKHRDWRYVLALGLLLDAAYALGGRWDAWAEVAQSMLLAARTLGDRAAEAMALHQLGTRALCVGETSSAAAALQAALELRTVLGDTAGAQVTQHNLSLVMAPPVPPQQSDDGKAAVVDDHTGIGALLGKAPMAAKALVALPLVAALTFIGIHAVDPPRLELDHTALHFPALAINRVSESQALTARNLGKKPVHVDGFTTTGPNATEFQVTGSTCLDKEIAAGHTCITNVVFTPAAAGPRQASLSMDVREMSKDPVSALAGSSPGPEQASLNVAPSELSFGEQPLNQRGERRQVRITGPPETSLKLGTAAVSGVTADYIIDADTCTETELAPGQSCTTGIRFTPSVAGSRNALLTLPTTDGKTAIAVPLSGAGATPTSAQAFRVQPSSLNFGEHPLNTASNPQRVTLTNPGDAALPISGVMFAGASDFTMDAAACPASLGPGDSCSVAVVFTPTATGPRTGQLLLGTAGRPTIPLRGSGAEPPPVAPGISPTSLAFGEQLVGTMSTARELTVNNRAATRLRLLPGTGGATVGAFRIDTTRCTTAEIGPRTSCTIPVTFAPTTAGSSSGILMLGVEGLPGGVAVVLTGVGIDRSTPLVPDVIGMSLPGAREALQSADLAPGAIRQTTHPDIPLGQVIDQSPPGGAPLPAGRAVDLVVSTGTALVAVPDVLGLDKFEAAVRLYDAGLLRMGAITEQTDPSIEPGLVLQSKPSAGTEVPVGSSVDLVLAQLPPTVVPLSPTSCPEGQVKNEAGACVPKPCAPNEVRNEAGACVPKPCAPNEVRNEAGACVPKPCARNEVRNEAGACVPKPCARNEVRNEAGACVPKPCARNEVRNEAGACVPKPCEPNEVRNDAGICEKIVLSLGAGASGGFRHDGTWLRTARRRSCSTGSRRRRRGDRYY